MHACPVWKVHGCSAPASARAGSASAKTMLGDLPPSSRSTRFMRGATASWMRAPTAELPVNEIMSTSAASTSASPISGPWPPTKLRTPGGRTAATIRQSAATPSGSAGAGFTTTVLPQARAAPIFPAQFVIGKLKGVMQATTPIGSRVTRPCARPRAGRGSSAGAAASSAARARRTATAPTCCVSATGRTAPVSAMVRSTRPGASRAKRSAASARRAARSAPLMARHGPRSKAARAARAAARTCSPQPHGEPRPELLGRARRHLDRPLPGEALGARDGVEPAEEEFGARLHARPGVEVARLVAVLETEHLGGDGDVVVDVLADRVRAALDRLLVVAHVLGDLGRRAEGEAERAQAELPCLDEGGRARAGDPDGP